MKHVFVETNFLIDLLRPFPSKDAEKLFARNDGIHLRLYVPWCSQSEAWRTLKDRIISEDLGFTSAMMQFARRRWLADKTSFDKREIDKLKKLADAARTEAITTLDQRLQETVGKLECINPSPAVIGRTLQVFTVKALKPFDEKTAHHWFDPLTRHADEFVWLRHGGQYCASSTPLHLLDQGAQDDVVCAGFHAHVRVTRPIEDVFRIRPTGGEVSVDDLLLLRVDSCRSRHVVVIHCRHRSRDPGRTVKRCPSP